MLGTEPAHDLVSGRSARCSLCLHAASRPDMPASMADAQACCTAGAGERQPTCVLIQLLHHRPQLEAGRLAQSLQQLSHSSWQPPAGSMSHTWSAPQAAGMPVEQAERAPQPPDRVGRLPTKRKLGLMPADEQKGDVYGRGQHQSSFDGTEAQQWEQVSLSLSDPIWEFGLQAVHM